MSYYPDNPFAAAAPTELTLPGRNPMLPQPLPGPGAAGPATLAGLGAMGSRVYAQRLRSQKDAGLRGFGSDDPTQILTGLLTPGVSAAADIVWPELEKRMNVWLMPLRVGMYVGMGLSAVGAAFAVMCWAERRKGH